MKNKYSVKHMLYEVGQKVGKAVSDTVGKKYEIKMAAAIQKLLSSITSLGGQSIQGGTTGADITITLANSTVIPVEAKTTLGATFGNTSLSFGEVIFDSNGAPTNIGTAPPPTPGKRLKRKKKLKDGTYRTHRKDTIHPPGGYQLGPNTMESPSKAVQNISTELNQLIAAANADNSTLIHGNDVIQAGGKTFTQGGSEGVSSVLKTVVGTGLIQRWYSGKGGKGADYIQIGKGKGLYLMPGSKDGLGINVCLKQLKKPPLPEFLPGKEYISLRWINKSPGVKPYIELKCSDLQPSPYTFEKVETMIRLLRKCTNPSPAGGTTPPTTIETFEADSTLEKLIEWAVSGEE